MAPRWDQSMIDYAAARYFDERGRPGVIAAELNTLCDDTKHTDESVRATMWRYYPQRCKDRSVAWKISRNGRDAAIRLDVEAGFVDRTTVARRNGVTDNHVSKVRSSMDSRADKLRLLNLAGYVCGPTWARDFPINPALEGPITSAGQTLFELGDNGCRYSIGRDPDGTYRFCGCDRFRKPGCRASAYCETHSQLVSVSARPSAGNDVTVTANKGVASSADAQSTDRPAPQDGIMVVRAA